MKCKGLSLAADLQLFTGLVFDRGSGRISLAKPKMWRLRLALLAAADLPYISGTELHRLIGHYTWLRMVRCDLLCAFTAAYAFIQKAQNQRRRIWGTVRYELRHASALVFFAFVDTRRPFCPDVCCSDAQGPDHVDDGGYAVVSQS